MCGIGGFIKERDVDDGFLRRLIIDLTNKLQVRGSDATGIYTSSKDGDIRKSNVAADKFYDWPDTYGDITFVHTRMATGGSPTNNNNNHPVSGDNIVLVHNGIVWMDRLDGYPYKGEVDTEIIVSYIERLGINKGLSGIAGSAAVAFCNKSNPDKAYLFSYDAPISMAFIPGYGILFASTMGMVSGIVDKYWKKWYNLFEPASYYSLSNGQLLEIDLHPFKITESNIPVTNIGFNLNGYVKDSYSTTHNAFNRYSTCDFCGKSGWVQYFADVALNMCESCHNGLTDNGLADLGGETVMI